MTKDMEKNLNPKQCMVMEAALESLKTYFFANGNGLKRVYLDKSSELQSLRYALSLYTQTTDLLIKRFVSTQLNQVAIPDHPAPGEEAVGEVSIQVMRWAPYCGISFYSL